MILWQACPWALVWLITAAVAVALALLIWRRRPAPGAGPFVVLMSCLAEWALAYALGLGSTTLSAQLFWNKVMYLGAVGVPVAYLHFALEYTQQERWLTRRARLGLLVVPAITLLLVCTTERHGLVWGRAWLVASGGCTDLAVTHGPWFWVHVTYSSALLCVSAFALLHAALRAPWQYRGQMAGLLLGTLLPWGGALLHAAFPAWGYLPVGIAVPLAALATAWSLFRFRLFDLVPVARAAVLEHMQEGVIVLDAQRHIADVNLEAQRLLGLTAAQVVGRPAAQVLADYPEVVSLYRSLVGILPPGEGAQTRRKGEDLAQGSGAAEFHVQGAGARRDFYMRVSPLLDRRARAVGSLVVLQDISAFKRVQEELQRRLRETLLLNRVIAAATSGQEPNAVLNVICEELARAFDLPQAAFALLSPERTHLTAVAEYRAEGRPSGLGAIIPLQGNQATQQLLEQRTPLVISNAQSDPRMAQVHDLQRKRGVVSELLVPLLVRDEVLGTLGLDALEAREFSAEEIALAQNVANAAGQALEHARLYAELQRELVERKRAEGENERLQAQLRQAQKMEAVGLLAGGVAHEFNNLLTVIQGNSELGLLQLQPEQPLHHELSTIQHSARRGAVLTQQLLAFSRRQTLQPQALDLNKLITDFVSAYSSVIGVQVDTRLELSPGLPQVQGDPGALEQVLMNLTLNARDAMPQGGTLRLATALVHVDDPDGRSHPGCKPGDYVRLSVIDTGVGMDEATREHLFEPFFTTKEVGRGTGLGLSMVYGLVLQHHGWVDVTSEVGQGTRFDVHVPVERET